MQDSSVWIFQGNNASFPSAVFSSEENAFTWISEHKVSGILTQYPVDISAYHWTIDNKFFVANSERKKPPEFIEGFSSAFLTHYHCRDGVCVS